MLTQNVEIIDFGKPILFASASLSLQSGRTWIEYIVLHVYTYRDSYRWSNIRTPPLLQQTQTLASIPNITYINHFKKNPEEIAKISYHYIWYYEGSECIKKFQNHDCCFSKKICRKKTTFVICNFFVYSDPPEHPFWRVFQIKKRINPYPITHLGGMDC